MSFHFRTLLTLSVSHGYYGGACADLGFVLPTDVARLLEGGRMLARSREGTLHVLADTQPGDTPRVSMAGRTLRLGLKQLNPRLANITEGLSVPPAVAYYRNSLAADQLDPPEQVTLVGAVFSHALKATERPVTVTLRNEADQVLHTETVTAADDRSSVSFDLGLLGLTPGALSVREAYPDDVTHTSAYYLDPELQQEGALAVLALRIDASFYGTAPAFTVAYEAREETLKYYLVASKYTDAEAAQLSIVDAGFTEDSRPQIHFTRVPAAAFTQDELPAALLGGNGTQVVLFRSQAPVPRRQAARRKLQLMRDQDILIEHLPQPGADRPHADIIIHVSKP